MPEFILVDEDDEVYYLHSDPFADDVHMITDNEPFYSLTSAPNKIFSPLSIKLSSLSVDCWL